MSVRTVTRITSVLVCLAFFAIPPALAEPSTADVQWAQRVLTEKGFDIGGRANGQMTATTRKALKAFQGSVGLPATGELDKATIDHMLTSRAKPSTMGTLGAPRPPSERKAPEKDVVPQASPSFSVQVEGGGEKLIAPAAPTGGPAASGTLAADGSRALLSGGATSGSPSSGWSLTSLLRPLAVLALIGTIGGLVSAWWFLGRRRAPMPPQPVRDPASSRREPVFDRTDTRPKADRRPTLTATRSELRP